jgi:hypothetical protein
LEIIIPNFLVKRIASIESFNKKVIEVEILVLYPWNGHQMLGPPGEFLGVFGYLIEN